MFGSKKMHVWAKKKRPLAMKKLILRPIYGYDPLALEMSLDVVIVSCSTIGWLDERN